MVLAGSKDGRVNVRVLNNGLAGAITIFSAEGEGKEATVNFARTQLKQAGVVFGIDDVVLNAVFTNNTLEQEIVVANGTPPKDGKDGKITFFFETDQQLKPTEDEKGNVDFKNINLLQNVKQGEKLVEVTPPVPGVEGKDVFGKKMLPKVGKVMRVPSGPNTELSPDNQNILISSKEGNVSLIKGLVHVESVFEVSKDVDYSTGNIEYVGSVVIKGSVRSGFEVKVNGDVEINGIVEDATVTAGGDIIIKNGFLGKNKGHIEAGGNIITKFIQNQNVKAKGDIIVGENVLHSNIQCEGKIEVTGRKGSIVGGYTSSILGVFVKELGNYQEVRTEVTVGVNEDLEKKLNETIEEIEKNDANAENVKKAIQALYKKKAVAKKLPTEQENLLKKLTGLQHILPKQKEGLELQKDALAKEIEQFAQDAIIEVTDKVYRGVYLRIRNKNKSISEEMNKTTFKIVDAEVHAARS
ncbi:MAG: DUF342 domain-containing protein [bacterium]|nr:DUF342 domain-containing protein [bacterium]